MTDYPCLNCPDRRTLCHSVCEKYLMAKESNKREYSPGKLAVYAYFSAKRTKIEARMRHIKGGR